MRWCDSFLFHLLFWNHDFHNTYLLFSFSPSVILWKVARRAKTFLRKYYTDSFAFLQVNKNNIEIELWISLNLEVLDTCWQTSVLKLIKPSGIQEIRMTSSKSVEMSAKKLGQVVAENCVVMVCDLQERFAPSILHFDIVVKNANKIAKCAQLLELPVLATEQYPRVRF